MGLTLCLTIWGVGLPEALKLGMRPIVKRDQAIASGTTYGQWLDRNAYFGVSAAPRAPETNLRNR